MKEARHVTIDEDFCKVIEEMAKENKRPFSNQLDYILSDEEEYKKFTWRYQSLILSKNKP